MHNNPFIPTKVMQTLLRMSQDGLKLRENNMSISHPVWDTGV